MTSIFLGGDGTNFWVRIENHQYYCSLSPCGTYCPYFKIPTPPEDAHWACTHHTLESYKLVATLDADLNNSKLLYDKINAIIRSHTTEEGILISLLEALGKANDSD